MSGVSIRSQSVVFAIALLAFIGGGCGNGTAARSPASGRSAPAGTSHALPNRIFEYAVSDTPKIPEEGREVVWYDPATGDLRDRSGIATAIRELDVDHGRGAIQTDWNGPGTPDTTTFTGDTRFIRRMRPGSAAWLIDAYLSHHLRSPGGRIVVSHRNGHLELSSTTGKLTVTTTVLRTIAPTPALTRRLFTLHPEHVTERIQQFSPASAGAELPGAFWLGAAWRGAKLDFASTDTQVGTARATGVSYGFEYGDGRIDVNSGPLKPGTLQLLTSSGVFGNPHPCTLGDGTPAQIFQFPKTAPPNNDLGASADRQIAKIRFRRIISTKQDTSIMAPVSLLPTLAGTCRALQPVRR